MIQEVLLGLVFTHVGHLSLNPEGDQTSVHQHGNKKKRRRDLPLQQQGAFENKPSVRQDVNKTKTNQFCTVIVHSTPAGL